MAKKMKKNTSFVSFHSFHLTALEMILIRFIIVSWGVYLLYMERGLKLLIARIAKGLGLKLPPIPTVSGLIVDKTKILMIKLSYKDGYALPGGGVDPGESFEDALKRELREELGLSNGEIQYLASSYAHKEAYSTVHVVFQVKTSQKEFESSPEGKPEWMTFPEAIQKCVYEDEKTIILRYHQGKLDS